MAYRFTSCVGALMVTLALAPAYGGDVPQSGPDDLVISIEGSCPGAVRFRWEGASPNEWAGLLYSDERGTITLSQPCGGTVIGLGPRGLRVVSVFRTGANGAGAVRGQADSRSCGGYLQMVVQDGYPCTTSNVVQVPQ